MSNQATSGGLNVPQRLSTLSLIEGRNCDPSSKKRPDLYVRGGALIKKNVCIHGNTYTHTVLGNFEGTIIGDTEVLGALDVYGNIHVGGIIAECDTELRKNLTVNGNACIGRHLKSKYASMGLLKVNTLDVKHVKNLDSLSLKYLDVEEGITTKDLTAKAIDAKAIDACDVKAKAVKAKAINACSVTASSIESSSAKLNAIIADNGLNIHLGDQSNVEIIGGDGIKLNGKSIYDVDVLETDVVTSEGMLNISPENDVVLWPLSGKVYANSEVNMLCHDITGVNSVEINQIASKSGSIQVKSDKTAFFQRQHQSGVPAQEKYINKLVTTDDTIVSILSLSIPVNTVLHIDSKVTSISDSGNAGTYSHQSVFKNVGGSVSKLTPHDQSFAFCEGDFDVSLQAGSGTADILVQSIDGGSVSWCAVTDVYYSNF
jgi:hypothetical protein